MRSTAPILVLFRGPRDADHEAEKQADNLKDFVTTDVGNLAVDAVEYVKTVMPGSASGTEKRDAAVAKLKEDLRAAGKDLSTIGTSLLNLFIAMAFQWVVTKA